MSELFPDLLPLTFSSPVSPARTSVWPVAARAWLEQGAASGGSSAALLASFGPASSFSKTSPACYPRLRGGDFAVLLRGLAKLGYHLAWRVLDSQYDRVAQAHHLVGERQVLEGEVYFIEAV